MSTRTPLSPRARAIVIAVDRMALNIARHWLLYGGILLFLYAGLPFLAPVAMRLGWTGVGRAIYTTYEWSCHQLAYRSWFLFGAQPSYSVDELQSALGVANPATDLAYWREVIGNDQLGYKMAYCERDVAIYGAILLAMIAFALVRGRVKPPSLPLYLLLIAPIAIDGFWQLFSYTPLVAWIPFHESTPLLRLVTGSLFGLASAWLLLPPMHLAMRDLERDTSFQLARAR